VIDEQLTRRIEAPHAQLAAYDLDEALMLHAIFGKEVGCTRLQRVDREELVAVICEQQYRRTLVEPAQRL
jgi:hypothetical protein